MYIHNYPTPTGIPSRARTYTQFAQLGQPPATEKKCQSFLSTLKLLQHFHIHRKPLITGVPGNGKLIHKWATSSAPIQVALQTMNPGYMDFSTGTFSTTPRLNQKLKDLTDNLLANKAPFDVEPYLTFVRSRAKLSIALVDLSTDAKLVFPQLAEFKSIEETRAASLAKIAGLYAVHQMRFDLNHEAKHTPAAMTASRLAALKKIFDITKVAGVFNFEFNSKMKTMMETLCSNCSASFIIGTLGTRYISSVVRQSGLYDCRLGGLWLGTTYAGSDEIKIKCPEVAALNAKLLHMREPIGNLFHGATALSAATFFTLLAQGRLVDESACLSMKDFLIRQKDNGCPSRFEEGLRSNGLAIDSSKVWSKIGVLPSKVKCAAHQSCCDLPANKRSASCTCTCFIHEGALIERVHNGKPLRYAVAVLTTSSPGDRANDLLIDIIAKLDELIRNN